MRRSTSCDTAEVSPLCEIDTTGPLQLFLWAGFGHWTSIKKTRAALQTGSVWLRRAVSHALCGYVIAVVSLALCRAEGEAAQSGRGEARGEPSSAMGPTEALPLLKPVLVSRHLEPVHRGTRTTRRCSWDSVAAAPTRHPPLMRANWAEEEEKEEKNNDEDRYLEMRSCSLGDCAVNTDVCSSLIGALWSRGHASLVRVRSGE